MRSRALQCSWQTVNKKITTKKHPSCTSQVDTFLGTELAAQKLCKSPKGKKQPRNESFLCSLFVPRPLGATNSRSSTTHSWT